MRKVSPGRSRRTVDHERFGKIPLVPIEWADAAGKRYETYDFDPEYRPPLPPRAIRGDPLKQRFCRMCHVPRYFYEDQQKRCVQCGEKFVFSAREQKHWYESLHFHFDSTAIRCVACRRQRRSVRGLAAELSLIHERLVEDPADPATLIALAQATARYHDLTGEGRLSLAIGAARKASKIWPEALEALFWEARCQEAAGREAQAQSRYGEFIERAGTKRGYRGLVREAHARLG